ncbi:MAG: hypothetical protein ACRD0P_18895 [Stackebrandtia sp.]
MPRSLCDPTLLPPEARLRRTAGVPPSPSVTGWMHRHDVLLGTATHTLTTGLAAIAAIVMGISTLVARNLVPVKTDRARMRLNSAVVITAISLSLGFGLADSDITSLLLLTYGGLTQLAPGIAIGLRRTVTIGMVPVLAGIGRRSSPRRVDHVPRRRHRHLGLRTDRARPPPRRRRSPEALHP